MNVLIIDTETNGADPQQHQVVEVGAVLYSVSHRTTICQVSYLCDAPHNDCEHINGIPLDAIKWGVEACGGNQIGPGVLARMVADVDYLIAHNADFDRGFFESLYPHLSSSRPWLCTCNDFSWTGKEHLNGKSLAALALGHGVGIGSAHRALTDCQLIAAVFDRRDDLAQLIEYAARPKAMFAAKVSYGERDLAKAAGFRWNQPGYEKQWVRRMAIEDAEQLGFAVRRLD